MIKPLNWGRVGAILSCLFLFAFPWCVAPKTARAYNPKSPKVVAMVQKARGFLAKSKVYGLGQQSMVAMALVKSGDNDTNPHVKAAIAACRAAIKNPRQIGSPANYHLGVAILFLADTDKHKYRPEMEALFKILLSRQQSHGAWSYGSNEGGHGPATGDASMSQYATLACWACMHAGIDVPQDAVERIFNFWLHSQTPAGAWGYQAAPGHPTTGVRPSIAAAGLSSIYVCGDMFGLGAQKKNNGAPSALKEVTVQAERISFKPRSIDVKLYRSAQSQGANWLAGSFNRGKYETGPWTIYYMYAMERFQSFRELADGRAEKDPLWYNIGVDTLAKKQSAEGSWKQHMSAEVDTSFALLFLIRSTKKSIVKTFGEGLLTGARGLDQLADAANLRIKDGKIVPPPLSGSVEDLLSILDNPSDPKMAQIGDNPDVLAALVIKEKDPKKKKSGLQQLKELVSTGDYKARKIAVRTLARAGSLENATTLIYALSDPDPRVMLEARDGLRFLSRKFQGFGLGANPSKQEAAAAIGKWREWLKAIRPETDLTE